MNNSYCKWNKRRISTR